MYTSCQNFKLHVGYNRGMEMIRLGERVRELRKAKRISPARLASELGVTRDYIYKIEGGERGASHDMLVLLADKLSTTVDFLLGNTEDWRIPEGEAPVPLPTVAPLVDRLNRVAERKDVLALVDGILTLAGQPAARIVDRPPEDVPLQPVVYSPPWESLTEDDRLLRSGLQLADEMHHELRERFLAALSERVAQVSARSKASSSSTVNEERKPPPNSRRKR